MPGNTCAWVCKAIKQISFRLPDGNWLTLKDYDEYNHIIEATRDFYGKKIISSIRFQYLMGRVENKVVSYRIVLFQSIDSKYKIGDITRREYEWGKEYSGKSTQGWKRGIKK